MPDLVDDVLTLRAHDAAYRLRAGAGLGAGIAPTKIARAMQHGRPYEAPLLEHIYALGLPRGACAVDVGANVGNHTLWLAAICGLVVHAFEPLVHEQLAANVALNTHIVDRVTVHPVALADDDTIAAGRPVHVGKGRLSTADRHRDGRDPLPTATLDDYDLDGVVVIKVDVEGMEPHVLRGAEHTISRCRPIIFAEEWADGPKWHRRIAQVLRPWGYRMTHRFAGRWSATPVGKWEPR